MSTTITAKLNKSANQFAAGDSTGFGLRLGVQYYDRKSKKKEYTNYSAVIFASQPAKIKYYSEVLVEGSVVEITGLSERIDSYEGNNGVSLSIELLDARLGYVHTSLTNSKPKTEEITTDNFVLNEDEDLPF